MLNETWGKLLGSRMTASMFVLVVMSHVCGCDPTKEKDTIASADKAADQPNGATSGTAGQETASGGAASPIGMVQGAGAKTTLAGEETEVSGIVTATFFDRGELGGFFLQDSTRDDNRSCALFIAARATDIVAGDRIQARGVVAEIDGMTALKPNGGSRLEYEKLGSDSSVDPFKLPPLDESFDWESVEGMVVTLPYPMYVVDTYDLARRGRVILAREPQRVPTDVSEPDKESFRKAEQAIKSARITLDDGITTQNKFPIPLLPGFGPQWETIRFGSRVTDLTGVVTEYKGDYYLIPTAKLNLEPQPRPERPSLGDANLVVASFNVLNFFTTIDNGSNGARGADNENELKRQREKIVAAIIDLNADVIGLMELENNLQAEQELVNALNRNVGSDVFAGCGLSDGFSEAPGATNKIRVGMIYRKDRVEQLSDLSHVNDPAFFNARTPLVGEFRPVHSDRSFALIVNHFKSKGARDAEGEDRDKKDGQAAYNAARTRQAKAITSFVDQVVQSGQPNVLVIGDLNAYRHEDPINVLRDAGLVDLLETKSKDPFPYTFVYFGQAGSLDQSFATAALAASVTQAEPWHINAAEPRFLDYNTEFNPKSLYSPGPFRSSDHDPVLIGLRLQ